MIFSLDHVTLRKVSTQDPESSSRIFYHRIQIKIVPEIKKAKKNKEFESNFKIVIIARCSVIHHLYQHWRGRGRQISEFKASLFYKVNSRTAKTTQCDSISKIKKQKKPSF